MCLKSNAGTACRRCVLWRSSPIDLTCQSASSSRRSRGACQACTLPPMRTSTRRPRPVTDDSALATRIGGRLKEARLRAKLTQQQLAGERYTKAYVSALENGLVRPSMAALNFFAGQLGTSPSRLIGDETPAW